MQIHQTKWSCCYLTKPLPAPTTKSQIIIIIYSLTHSQIINSIDLSHSSNSLSKPTNRNSSPSQISNSHRNSSHRWTISSNSKYTGSRAASLHTIIKGKTQIAHITICQASKCLLKLSLIYPSNSSKLWHMCKTLQTITILVIKTAQTMSKAVQISMLRSFWTETTSMLAFTHNQTVQQLNLPHQPSRRFNSNRESQTKCCPWQTITRKIMQIVEGSKHRIICNRCSNSSNSLIKWCNSSSSIRSSNSNSNMFSLSKIISKC